MAEAEKHSFTSKGGKESSGVHNLYLNFLCLDNIQLNDGNFNNRALRMVLWWICILSLEYGLFIPIFGENCVCKVWRLTTNLGKRNLTLWRMMNRVDWLQILNNLYNWKKKKRLPHPEVTSFPTDDGPSLPPQPKTFEKGGWLHPPFSKVLGQGALIVESMKSRMCSKDREIYPKTTVSGHPSTHHSASPFA